MPHYRQHLDPTASHARVRRLVRELAGGGPVLDVGAAHGALGASLAGSGIVIDAIEPDPVDADLARPHYRQVHCCRVESAPLPPAHYHVIVCADVLEHTADPADVLLQLRAAARPDARFIISLPNAVHIAVRMMMLFGHLPKMERGILDRTHLHFFTRTTATALLATGGLRVERVGATGVPLEELLQRPPGGVVYESLSLMQRSAVRLLPRLFAYQWIFVARLPATPQPATSTPPRRIDPIEAKS
jgi:SAM-dependent methyltransferase